MVTFDLLTALRIERQRNFQFLVDMRDGLLPSTGPLDRLRAAESLLDRDPETARVRGESDVPVATGGVAPKLFELGDIDLSDGKMQPPPGWRDEPLSEEKPDAGQPEGRGTNGEAASGDVRARDDGRAHPNGDDA